MGASESTLSSSQSQTSPILTSPPSTEGSLTDILVRRSSSSSAPCTVDPKVLLELFSMYREWQENKAQQISKRQVHIFLYIDLGSEKIDELYDAFSVQEELENRIEVADALAVKILRRFSYSVSSMKTNSQHLSEASGVHYLTLSNTFAVHTLQVGLGELKGRLTEVISNCDALCKRIASEGPQSLRASIKPFAAPNIESQASRSSSSSVLQDCKNNSSSTEANVD
ncbi:hypothetical protein EZV62_014343 [Acer yangbiense]|uniref:Uncharacterized protein n=1 Tax=Acer yangbiense TaxID=1000413 RepID=A0A5C7HS03_9ROSI|nr:hypothetical protein EZV62_014343 [Acer yangbiense]